MNDSEELRVELSNLVEECMGQYWRAINSHPRLGDAQFERLCQIGCDFEAALTALIERAVRDL